MTDEEFQSFVTATTEELKEKQELLKTVYSIGSFKDFWLDQTTGLLQFKDSSGSVQLEARVTPIGSFSNKSGRWQWAWANKSVVESLRLKSEKLKGLGGVTGLQVFELPTVSADEVMAWEFAGMAVNFLSSLGCYRTPFKHLQVFFSIDGFGRLN